MSLVNHDQCFCECFIFEYISDVTFPVSLLPRQPEESNKCPVNVRQNNYAELMSDKLWSACPTLFFLLHLLCELSSLPRMSFTISLAGLENEGLGFLFYCSTASAFLSESDGAGGWLRVVGRSTYDRTVTFSLHGCPPQLFKLFIFCRESNRINICWLVAAFLHSMDYRFLFALQRYAVIPLTSWTYIWHVLVMK